MEGWTIPGWSKLVDKDIDGAHLLFVNGKYLKDLVEKDFFNVMVGDNAVRFDLCKVVVESREERIYNGLEESHMGTVEHARAVTLEGVEILLRPYNVYIRSISKRMMKEIKRSKVLEEISKLRNREDVLRATLTKLEAEIAEIK